MPTRRAADGSDPRRHLRRAARTDRRPGRDRSPPRPPGPPSSSPTSSCTASVPVSRDELVELLWPSDALPANPRPRPPCGRLLTRLRSRRGRAAASSAAPSCALELGLRPVGRRRGRRHGRLAGRRGGARGPAPWLDVIAAPRRRRGAGHRRPAVPPRRPRPVAGRGPPRRAARPQKRDRLLERSPVRRSRSAAGTSARPSGWPAAWSSAILRESGYALLMDVHARHGEYRRGAADLRRAAERAPARRSASAVGRPRARCMRRSCARRPTAPVVGRPRRPRAASPLPCAPARRPFVGRRPRSTAWARLGACERRRLAAGPAHGEAGIGKTRLAAQLAEQGTRPDATVLYGRCDQELSCRISRSWKRSATWSARTGSRPIDLRPSSPRSPGSCPRSAAHRPRPPPGDRGNPALRAVRRRRRPARSAQPHPAAAAGPRRPALGGRGDAAAAAPSLRGPGGSPGSSSS